MSSQERKLMMTATDRAGTPSPLTLPLHFPGFEPLLHRDLSFQKSFKHKYSDNMLPPPEKFSGALTGVSISLFLNQMRAYLSTQLGIATPVESEWGTLLFNHLGGDALDLVHAEMEAVKRPLTWTETCTLLMNAFVDLTHTTIHLGEQLDALTFQEFDGKGGLVAFCHKYQSLATKLGSRRPNEDHIKHLYDILPERMCAMLNAKFDFSQSVKLTDVLHALRTSRFGLESASSTAKSKD